MSRVSVEEITLPQNSPLRESMPQADFEEAYSRTFTFPPELTALTLFERTLSQPPLFFSFLIHIKNLFLKPLGFSSVKKENFVLTEMGRDTALALFEDKHFCAHFVLSFDRENQKLVLGNRVRLLSLIGQVYFNLVLPIHREFIKYVLSSMK